MTHSAVTNVRGHVFCRIRSRHERLDEAGGQAKWVRRQPMVVGTDVIERPVDGEAGDRLPSGTALGVCTMDLSAGPCRTRRQSSRGRS
jgi:hypothetical protein